MGVLNGIEPNRVFQYFEEICAIPRGSGNRKNISDYIVKFAEKYNLECIRDKADNVIIFKNSSTGYEKKEPIIIQGHLDMVCQKESGYCIDFEKEGIAPYINGDYIKANGTTLGGDNGIAVAMMLAILESDSYMHPPIEAIFTSDEEIGMLGAKELSTKKLKGRRMINLDSEEQNYLTVSCAGGSEFYSRLKLERTEATGRELVLSLKGFIGGHSGIEIDKGRINADVLLGRILNKAESFGDFDIISVNGGDKSNAIPPMATARLLVRSDDFEKKLIEYIDVIKEENSAREPHFEACTVLGDVTTQQVLESDTKARLIFMLLAAPDGVMQMSAEIENLVETSLNLGVLKTEDDMITFCYALRSNKKTALVALEERLISVANMAGCSYDISGSYPPWEYNENSPMQKLYLEVFKEKFGFDAKIIAIHAGLECGMFADKIENLDCISFGPDMFDVHTVNERLSISSTRNMFELLLTFLEKI